MTVPDLGPAFCFPGSSKAQGAVNPWALLLPGNCELQQQLFPWLERVYGLSPLRILQHLITSEVMHLPFPRSGCSQGFLPLPGVRSGSSWSARSVTPLNPDSAPFGGMHRHIYGRHHHVLLILLGKQLKI